VFLIVYNEMAFKTPFLKSRHNNPPSSRKQLEVKRKKCQNSCLSNFEILYYCIRGSICSTIRSFTKAPISEFWWGWSTTKGFSLFNKSNFDL